MKPFSYHPFDLRQLVSFAEIARTGSFREAAKTALCGATRVEPANEKVGNGTGSFFV
jgi:hypothetical protein